MKRKVHNKPAEAEALEINTVQNVQHEPDLPKSKDPEEIAFRKSQKKDYDPNRLENPYFTAMNEEKAKDVVKSYGKFDGDEVPNDLAQARKVLGK